MTTVLDVSALLAYLGDEPGAQPTEAAIAVGAVMSAVNAAEVVSKLSDRGFSAPDAMKAVAARVGLESFTGIDALSVAQIRAANRSVQLSLGDRACLALASRLGADVLSAEQSWTHVNVGAKVILIR